MDVSRIGGFNPYTVIAHKPSNNAINKNQKEEFDKSKIDSGCVVEISSEPVDEKKKDYDSYLSEYYGGLTNGKGMSSILGDFGGMSLEDIYKYSMEQYDKIEKGTHDNETKDMRRVALEEALKKTTFFYSITKTAHANKIAPPERFEKDQSKRDEMKIFNYNQEKAVINSVKKLTLNFLDFIKNNKGNDSETMLSYINKNSSNGRDINSLSIHEIEGFIDYAKNSDHMYSQTNADADFYKGYFNTLSDGSANKALDNIWGVSTFDNAIYQKYGNKAFKY